MPHAMASASGEQLGASNRLLLAGQRPERASWSPQGPSEQTGRGETSRNSFVKKQEAQEAIVANHEQVDEHEHDDREHEPSGSTSSERSANSDEEGERATSAEQAPGGAQAAGKSHVGPMGIFFKVWSLVKVTKARHNKMKRQHSEDASQFHFIPGSELLQNGGTLPASPAAPSAHSARWNPRAQPHLEGHFARAGSQPPPSGHLPAGRQALAPSNQLQLQAQGHRLQQQQQQQQQARVQHSGQLQTASISTSGTNSSSSGVSSTASSTLATNSYGASGASETSPQASTGTTRARGWAARMKRGPAAVLQERSPAAQERANQQTGGAASGSSYVSRYRSRRALEAATKRQVAADATGPATGRQSTPGVQQVAAEAAKRELRAHSEASPGQIDELRRRAIAVAKSSAIGSRPKLASQRLRRARRRRDSISDEDDDEEEEEEQQQLGQENRPDEERSLSNGRTLVESGSADDSDLNDIYSTPNDSIQSVPSGGRTQPETTGANSQGSVAVQRVGGRPSLTGANQPPTATHQQRMTKSFSTNNFGGLQQHQQQHQQQQNLQNGHRGLPSSASRPNFGLPAGQAGRRLQETAQGGPQQPVAPRVRTSTSSSRFFISSSSSEDSNPSHQQHQPAVPAGRLQVSGSQQVQMSTERLALGSGLHYHAPARPNSLLLGAPNQHPPAHLLTPSALIMNGLAGPAPAEGSSPSVAAMSPLGLPVGGPAHFGPAAAAANQRNCCQLVPTNGPSNYKKSPSLFEMCSRPSSGSSLVARFSSKYPWPGGQQEPAAQLSSFLGGHRGAQVASSRPALEHRGPQQQLGGRFNVPHSISLHDCKLTTPGEQPRAHLATRGSPPRGNQEASGGGGPLLDPRVSEYKLAQMLLGLGSNQAAKDERGFTALMHAIISENLSAMKCLIEHGVDLNETNDEGLSALDLVACSGLLSASPESRLEMMKLLIERGVDLDRPRPSDGLRLLDRLIVEHQPASDEDDHEHDHQPNHTMAFIECLLHNGAKMGSATWAAASGKEELQLRLLRKLCQDGYFLYKNSSIEAAVFRFEYALKRIANLEQQLEDREGCRRRQLQQQRQHCSQGHKWLRAGNGPTLELQRSAAAAFEAEREALGRWAAQTETNTRAAVQQVKYQTFLGLSRCERKRKFFKRALEFAHMSILVDSTAYEGYYSKAHILKDLGEHDNALLAIDQTERLVRKSIENIRRELCDLENQEESIVFDGCFQMRDPNRSQWIEANRTELNSTLDYLTEAQKHIAWLQAEILNDKSRTASS